MKSEYYIPKECPKCKSTVAIRYMKDIAIMQKKPTEDIPSNEYGCGSCCHTWIEENNRFKHP